jgi:hypothetical protein
MNTGLGSKASPKPRQRNKRISMHKTKQLYLFLLIFKKLNTIIDSVIATIFLSPNYGNYPKYFESYNYLQRNFLNINEVLFLFCDIAHRYGKENTRVNSTGNEI